jgi:hypothetical protein
LYNVNNLWRVVSVSEFLSELHPIVILIVAVAAAFILKSVPYLSYPFRLFFTMIHEMGHVFAVRLTGGEVVRFTIARDGSGLATYRGGNDLLVAPAGYLGVALFSAVLILLSGFPEIARLSLGTVAGMFILLVVLYGHTSFLTLIVGLIFGAGLFWIAVSAPVFWSVFMLNLLAIMGGLTSLDDLRMLRLGVRYRAWFGRDDASQMAQRVGCSPVFWASVWFVCSALILGTAIWLTWFNDLFE